MGKSHERESERTPHPVVSGAYDKNAASDGKDIRNVDAVLQLLDARIPRSSLNPEIARITAGKPHLYVLNKADLPTRT